MVVLGFLDYIFRKKKLINTERNDFDKEAYEKYNEKKIKEFTNKYTLRK